MLATRKRPEMILCDHLSRYGLTCPPSLCCRLPRRGGSVTCDVPSRPSAGSDLRSSGARAPAFGLPAQPHGTRSQARGTRTATRTRPRAAPEVRPGPARGARITSCRWSGSGLGSWAGESGKVQTCSGRQARASRRPCLRVALPEGSAVRGSCRGAHARSLPSGLRLSLAPPNRPKAGRPGPLATRDARPRPRPQHGAGRTGPRAGRDP